MSESDREIAERRIKTIVDLKVQQLQGLVKDVAFPRDRADYKQWSSLRHVMPAIDGLCRDLELLDGLGDYILYGGPVRR